MVEKAETDQDPLQILDANWLPQQEAKRPPSTICEFRDGEVYLVPSKTKPAHKSSVTRHYKLGQAVGSKGIFGGVLELNTPSGETIRYAIFVHPMNLKVDNKNEMSFETAKHEVTTRRSCGYNFARYQSAEEQTAAMANGEYLDRWAIPTMQVWKIVAENLKSIDNKSLDFAGENGRTYISFSPSPKGDGQMQGMSFQPGEEPKRVCISKQTLAYCRLTRFERM